MLLGAQQRGESNAEATYGSVHNYYERLVFEELANVSERAREDAEFFADVCCVALNHLPPKYVRHDVDLTFFLSPEELSEIITKVSNSVQNAIGYVEKRSQTPKAQ